MTQKELAYVEDATMHEANIIKILNELLSNAEDENIINFLSEELTVHQSMKEKLINLLEEKSNE